MLNNKSLALCFVLTSLSFNAFAQDSAQNADPEAKLEEFVEKEVSRLELELKLEDWQLFYVDSTLRHDYQQMTKEMMQLQRARVENPDLYYNIQDKWTEATQLSYRRFFSKEQWTTYLKRGGEKIIFEREKRRAKAQGIKIKEIPQSWR